jgi:hypothetical protein
VEDYDAFIPGSGVLIWHIDDGVIEAHAADGAINNRPERQGIALEEADGYRDIGNPVFERLRQIEGSPDDPFFVGGQTLFGPGTRPDTRSNRGWDTGIEIEVLSDLGDTMQVAIRFAHSRPGWPLALAGDGLLQAADLDGDGADELIFEADAGIGYADAAGIAEWRLAASRLLAVGDGDGDGLAEIFSLGDEVAAWPLHADEPLWSTDLAGTAQDALFDANKRLGEGVRGPALLLAGPEQLNIFIADTGALWDRSSPTGFLASMKVQDGGSAEDVFVATVSAIKIFSCSGPANNKAGPRTPSPRRLLASKSASWAVPAKSVDHSGSSACNGQAATSSPREKISARPSPSPSPTASNRLAASLHSAMPAASA